MRKKEKNFWNDLIARDNKQIEKIERARARRDAKFFNDWFDRYNKEGNFWEKEKSSKDNWL
jgi:hypothetical protein